MAWRNLSNAPNKAHELLDSLGVLSVPLQVDFDLLQLGIGLLQRVQVLFPWVAKLLVARSCLESVLLWYNFTAPQASKISKKTSVMLTWRRRSSREGALLCNKVAELRLVLPRLHGIDNLSNG